MCRYGPRMATPCSKFPILESVFLPKRCRTCSNDSTGSIRPARESWVAPGWDYPSSSRFATPTMQLSDPKANQTGEADLLWRFHWSEKLLAGTLTRDLIYT